MTPCITQSTDRP